VKIPGFNLNVTFDTVVQTKKKAEIQAEAKELAGGIEDSKKWLPHYQTAKKNIKEQLTNEEKAIIEEEVKVWKEVGIPRKVQAQ